MTDNDKRGWKPNRKMKQWYEYDLKSKGATVSNPAKGDVIISSLIGLINDSASVKLNFTVNSEGVIKVDYWLDVKPGLPNIPKIGMQAGINKNYTRVEYFGRGPWKLYRQAVCSRCRCLPAGYIRIHGAVCCAAGKRQPDGCKMDVFK